MKDDIERSLLENKRHRDYKTKQEADDKKILSLIREYDKLWEATRNANFVEIEPYHDGYHRILVLKEMWSENKLANDLIKVVQNKIWCRDKKFLYKNYKTRKWEPMGLYPRTLFKNEYDKLPNNLKKCFYEHLWHGANRYVLNSEHEKYFTHIQKKFYVTKKYVIEPQLVSQIQEISNYLTTHNMWNRWEKLKGGRNCDWDWLTAKDKLTEKTITKELQTFLNCDRCLTE